MIICTLTKGSVLPEWSSPPPSVPVQNLFREAWGSINNDPNGLHIPGIYPDFYREGLGAVLLTSRMVFTSPSGAWGGIIFEAWGGIIFMDSRQY